MKIIALAINTFREAIRDKVLYSLIFFAVLMIGISVILDNLTIGEPTKIIKDFGLASIEIFGVLIAIFVGIGLVYKEMERKTIYNILSKPIHRYQFIIGKYLGLVLTLLVEVLTMSIALFSILYFYEGKDYLRALTGDWNDICRIDDHYRFCTLIFSFFNTYFKRVIYAIFLHYRPSYPRPA